MKTQNKFSQNLGVKASSVFNGQGNTFFNKGAEIYYISPQVQESNRKVDNHNSGCKGSHYGILKLSQKVSKFIQCRIPNIFRFALNCTLGVLFLLCLFPQNEAKACDPFACTWFYLKHVTGPNFTAVRNLNSYESTRIRYEKITVVQAGSASIKFLVSERSDGGSWTDSNYVSGTAAKIDYPDVDINQAVRLQVPKDRLNRDPLGSWYLTGPGTHSDNNRFTFIPDVDAVNRIQKGHKIDVRVLVTMHFNGADVRNREYILTFTNLASTNLSWEENNSPQIVFDGSSTYGELDGLITNSPTGSVPLLFGGYEQEPDDSLTPATVGNTRDVTSKFPGWDVPVGENFKYGFWIISRNGDKFLYRPNSVEINKLSSIQTVTSVLEVTPHDGKGNPIGDKQSIRVTIGRIGVTWNNDVELDSEGNPIITIDHTFEYEDLHATLNVVKERYDYYHGGADDYLNGKMKIVGSNNVASGDADADNLPTGFVLADTRVYGRGWSTGPSEHRGGVWFFDGKKELVAFRPIKERLDKLEPGDSVESNFELKIVRGPSGGTTTVATKTLKVTIRRAYPAKVSINDIELGEDTGSADTEFRFRVSIDSDTALGESFTVPVAFSYGSTNDGDFVSGQDFDNLDVTFGTGDTEKFIPITVSKDTDKEPNESFTLRLSEPTGDAKNSNFVTLDTELGANVGTGTIVDDDRAQLSIDDVSKVEGDGDGSTEFQFTVSLSPATALNQTFKVPITFAHVTTNTKDFVNDPTQTNFDVDFGTTDTSKTISVMVNQDRRGEENERFTLTLSEPTGNANTMNLVTLSSAPGATVGLGTINNDDQKRITSTWLAGFGGNIVSDGFSDQYEYQVALITDDIDNNVRYDVTEIENDNVINSNQFSSFIRSPRANLNTAQYPEFTGINSTVYKGESNFVYGNWYYRAATGCITFFCRHLLFIPNSSAINQLNPGDVVTSTFSYSIHNDSGAIIETSPATVTITADFGTNLIGFDFDSRRIEVGESESVVLNVSIPEGLSGPVTIPFTVTDETAKLHIDFDDPPSNSLTIPDGQTSGSISIPLVDDSTNEDDESFTVSLSDGDNFMITPALQSATVTILDNDPISTSDPAGGACHEVTQPSTVTTPNTEAYWETKPYVYQESNDDITARMGFRVPGTQQSNQPTPTRFRLGIYYANGDPENEDIGENSAANASHHDFSLTSPRNYTGYLYYKILLGSETGNKWYDIGTPCDFHIWWTDANRPGIALSIEQDTVLEGKSFRVKATATPAPNRDLLIPVFLSDESRIEDSQTYSIRIESGQTTGHKDIHTKFMTGTQTADQVVASTVWRNSYWLDSSDAVKSDSVTIQDHDKKLVEFKNPNPNITVNETGNADLVVKYDGTPSQRVTVKYQLGGDDDTAGTTDFMEPSAAEISIPATSNEATITISISEDTAHEETEFFTVTLIESDDAVPSDRNSVATVTIFNNDRPTESPPSSSCDAVTQPVGVSTPNTQANWAAIPAVYQESNDGNITVRMGFRNPSNPPPTEFKIGIYNIDGTVVDNNVNLTSVANTDHLDFPLTPPTDDARYRYYRILESNHSDNRWYSIDTPCDFHIWWVDEDRPGITLTIDEESVVEGESATVTATAVPEPSQDLLVPFSISDVSRIENSQVYSILIRAGQSSGQTELLTKSVPGNQTANELTVTAEWQSSYLLDEDAASDMISIVEETGVSLISINDLTQAEDDDSGSTEYRFKVSLSPATAVGQAFTVPVEFEHVSTDVHDFVPSQDLDNLDVTFGTGDTEREILIVVNSDSVKEPDETFTLTLSEPTGNAKTMNLVTLSSVQGETVGTGTITNDDPATVSIASVTMDEDTETGGNRFLFAVSLSPAVALGQTFAVPITFSKVSADDDDFVTGQDLENLSAVFGIADTERTVPVVVELDYINEPDETFTLTLGEPTGDAKNANLVTLSSVQGETVATGTIVNNDQATISINNVTKAEGTGSENTKFEFKVSLSPAEALTQDFSVPLAFKHVSTDPADFVEGSLAAIPASVNFAAADAKTENKIEITVKADNMGESNETFTLTLSEPTGAAKDMNLVNLSATENVGTGTITTDDGSVVSIDSLSMEENSGIGGSTLFRFTVNLLPAEALNQPFSVPVAFGHGNTNSEDFASGSLESLPSRVDFAAGDTSATIDIMVGWDDENEGDENFMLTISEPTGPAKVMELVTLNSTPGGNVGTGRIVNDDQATLSINSVMLEENSGADGSTPFQFRISLTPAEAINQEFTVPVTFKHGTTNDADFVSGSVASIPASVDFGSTDTSETVDVPINWDNDIEGDETFTLTLAEPTGDAKDMNLVKLSEVHGATVGTGTVIGDDQPVIDFPSEVYAHEGAVEAEIPLTLNRTSGADISVTASTVEVSGTQIDNSLKATSGTDFTALNGAAFNIPANSRQAVLKIPIENDTIKEKNERFRVEVSGGADFRIANADNLGRRFVDVVIIDDDTSPVVEISAAGENVAEGGMAEFTVRASYHDNSAGPVVVDLLLTQSGNYLAWGARSVSVSVGSTAAVSLATLDNEKDDGGGTVTAAISETARYVLHPGGADYTSATVTIADNDSVTPTSPNISVVSAVISSILLEIPATEPGGFNSNLNLPVVSILAVEAIVREGDPIRIAVTVTGENHSGIKVSIGLRETGDYVDESEPVIVTIPSESNSMVHAIPTVGDDLSEADGIVTAFILASDEYNLGDPSTVEVRVTDEDDQLARRAQVSAAQQAMLPELVGSIGARSLGAMSLRMERAFANSTDPELQLGGASTLNELLTSGARSLDAGSVSWEEVLGDSSFSFDLLPEGNGASIASVWGLGDFRNLSNGSASLANALDGDVFTGHIGIDTRIGEGSVAGITTSLASAEADYGQGNGRINFQTRTTGLHPYIGWRSDSGDDRLDLIAGYGLGEVGLDQVRYSAETLQSSFYNVGLSGSARLYSDEALLGGAASISVTGDSWLARHFLKNDGGFVEGAQTKVGYARIAVEGVQEYELARGGRFSAESRLGIGADEKANQSFIGLLLETGLGYENPFGLTLAGDSVMVATNGGQIRELELTGDMSFDRDWDERGLMLNVIRNWEMDYSETDKPLWNDSLLNNTVLGDGETDSRIEIGYGFAVLDDTAVITPYSAYNQANSRGTELRVGSRIATGKGHNFELEIGRDVPATGTLGHEVNLTGNIRW